MFVTILCPFVISLPRPHSSGRRLSRKLHYSCYYARVLSLSTSLSTPSSFSQVVVPPSLVLALCLLAILALTPASWLSVASSPAPSFLLWQSDSCAGPDTPTWASAVRFWGHVALLTHNNTKWLTPFSVQPASKTSAGRGLQLKRSGIRARMCVSRRSPMKHFLPLKISFLVSLVFIKVWMWIRVGSFHQLWMYQIREVGGLD